MIQPRFNLTTQKAKENWAEMVLEPLDQGYGQTLGNALRRVLLSSLEGAAITAVKIDGVQHQFSTLSGLREDIVELILNLKQVRFQYAGEEPTTARLKARGRLKVTAGMMETPANLTIVNPDLVVAELTDAKADLGVDLTIERGFGYSLAEERKTTTVGIIPVDALFTPVTRVAYRVEATRVGRRTDFDKLILEVWTDGTITPVEAVKEAAKILVGHFRQVFDPVKVVAEMEKVEEVVGLAEVDHLTVEELELPTRIANALRKGGYKTVKDLRKASKNDLKKIKNLGDKSVKMVLKALKKKGIELTSNET
ncbi:MAG: DNA-directed RNA polymerase subunit alpha [Candidatus Chisholmbacteria bacterium]|nr:DNA-directed RNA polymerase subunit alpha [Candidatus Chisholmbacteria bacterium]